MRLHSETSEGKELAVNKRSGPPGKRASTLGTAETQTICGQRRSLRWVTLQQQSHHPPEGWKQHTGPTGGQRQGRAQVPDLAMSSAVTAGSPCLLCHRRSRLSWKEALFRGTDKSTPAAATDQWHLRRSTALAQSHRHNPDSLAVCQAQRAVQYRLSRRTAMQQPTREGLKLTIRRAELPGSKSCKQRHDIQLDQVTSHIPQESVQGPMPFSILISDLDSGTEHTPSEAADSMKCGAVADTPDCCAAIQKDLNRLEKRPPGREGTSPEPREE